MVHVVGMRCGALLTVPPVTRPLRPPQSAPVLDVCGLLRRCVGRGRAVLTLPWMVEFLSMMDFTGPLLPCYRSALGSLLLLYR